MGNMNNKKLKEVSVKRSASIYALFVAVSVFAVYELVFWAIDSGSLIVYALAFGSFYAFVYYLKLLIKVMFFNNEKSAKTRSSKR